MNIIVKNLRTEQLTQAWQVRVDRTSVLGNPFPMAKESERNIVCEKYRTLLLDILKNPEKGDVAKRTAFRKELLRLIEIAEKYGKLELFCWCAPKRCHADTLAKYINYAISKRSQKK